MPTRRSFLLLSLPIAGTACGVHGFAHAEAPHLRESDEEARRVSYAEDAKKVDRKAHPEWAAGRTCANCQIYGGEPGARWGSCVLMNDKLVNAKGWCSAWEQG